MPQNPYALKKEHPLDGAGWHRARELRLPPTLKLRFLPPYSPELNPVEPLWRHLRETHLGNRVFDTLDEVEDSLCAALGQLIRPPETVRSIACFDWLNTLSMMSN
jgi:transposase